MDEFGDGVGWIRGPLIGKGGFGRVYKAAVRNFISCFPSEMAVKTAEVSVSATLQNLFAITILSRKLRLAMDEFGDGVGWIRGPLIGKGGFGRVYKAAVRNFISCFPSEMAVKTAEVSVSATLQKERQILIHLDPSPYVIDSFGEETTIGDNGAMAYNLLLEYGSGGSLADRIKNEESGLPELEVRAHTRSILRGLCHVHYKGYVHRDLKPDNIFLVAGITGFRAKIGDFGLAKREKQARNRKRKLIETCYWRGTPAYLSPESVIHFVQEAPSDIWALGCIVLEMLTGTSAWEGTNKEILTRIGTENELPKIPIELLSKDAADFLNHCFVRNPLFRFTSEMLLMHPFVHGLCQDDDDIQGLNEECSSEHSLSNSLPEEDSDYTDDDILSPLCYDIQIPLVM